MPSRAGWLSLSETDTNSTYSKSSGFPTAPQLAADFVIPTSEMVTARVVYERAKVISPLRLGVSQECLTEESDDLVGSDLGGKEGGDFAYVGEELAVPLHQWHVQERLWRVRGNMEAVQEFQRKQAALQELQRRQIAAAQLGAGMGVFTMGGARGRAGGCVVAPSSSAAFCGSAEAQVDLYREYMVHRALNAGNPRAAVDSRSSPGPMWCEPRGLATDEIFPSHTHLPSHARYLP